MSASGLLERSSLRGRSDSLDALRAGLALWVVVAHLAEWGPLSKTGVVSPVAWIDHWTVRVFQSRGETNPAVLVFIVLSGYCIHRAGARRGGSWRSAGYAIKRFFRIWPVYMAASVFGALVFWLVDRGHEQLVGAITETRSIGFGCMSAKLVGLAAFAPGLTRCSYQGNAPLATVMVEMWLYVVYGLLVWLMLRRLSERALWGSITAFTLAGLAFVQHDPSAYGGWWNNSSLLGYLPYWWIGAAVVARPDRRRVYLAGVGAAATWALMTVLLWTATLSPGSSFLAAEARKLVFAVAVGALITALDAFVRKLPAALAAFGRSGYSLYAFHAPILIVTVALGWWWWAGAVASLAFALFSYRFYERPLLLKGRTLAAMHFGPLPEATGRLAPAGGLETAP